MRLYKISSIILGALALAASASAQQGTITATNGQFSNAATVGASPYPATAQLDLNGSAVAQVLYDFTAGAADSKFWAIRDYGSWDTVACNDALTVCNGALSITRTGAVPQISTFATSLVVNPAASVAVGVNGLGTNNVRLGVNGTPRVIFEALGANFQIQEDNNAGQYRIARTRQSDGGCPTTGGITLGCVPLSIDGNINLEPSGKYVLPTTPYGVNLGSPQKPFDGLWVGSLFAQTLVTIENIATVDNRWLVGSGNILDADVAPGDTSIITKYNNFAVNDFVYLQARLATEFMKITAGPTLSNLVSNASFEDGTVTNWATSAGSSVVNGQAKYWKGSHAMRLNYTSGTQQLAYAGATASANTAYTACAYFRRTDGFIPAVGDIQVTSNNGTFVNTTIEVTGTDGWVRACASFTSGASTTETRIPYYNFPTPTFYDIDAVQVETGSTIRPYSDIRSTYTVTRNQDATIAKQWYSGDALFDTGGAAGYGWLDCYSVQGMGGQVSGVGPACVANMRIGTTFNAWAPRAAWGQLNGLYDYTTSTFGFASGPVGGTWIAMDPTNGFRITNGTTRILQFDSSGSGFLTGHLAIGNPAPTALDTNTGLWMDYNGGTPQFRVGTPGAGNNHIRWDGTNLEVVSQNLTMNQSGVSIVDSTGSAWNALNAYAFTPANGAATSGFGLQGWETTAGRGLNLRTIYNDTSRVAQIDIGVGNANAEQGNINIACNNLSSPACTTTIASGIVTFSGASQLNIAGNAGQTKNVVIGACTMSYTLGVLTSTTGC